MGDEDDDWAVLEQRKDFSEMDGPEDLSPTSLIEPDNSGDDSDLWLRILLALVLGAGLVSWWIGYR
jgi:hypothetical protein